MIPFEPRVEGSVAIVALPADFFARLARRVETGLLRPGDRGRANYRVVRGDPEGLRFRAADLPTAINVGLNDVTVRREGAGLAYSIDLTTWSFFVLSLCATVALLLSAFYFAVPAVRAGVDKSLAGGSIFWTMLAFWGLAWPGILTWIHKKRAAKLLEAILVETARLAAPKSDPAPPAR